MAKTEGYSIHEIYDIVDQAQADVNRATILRTPRYKKEENLKKFVSISHQLDNVVKAAKDKGIISTGNVGGLAGGRRYSVAEVLGILGELTTLTFPDNSRGRKLRAIPITKESVTRAEEILLYNAVGKNPPPKKRV